MFIFTLVLRTDTIIAEATDDSECIHYFLYRKYVEVTIADENTWGETQQICTECGTVLDTIMIHPYSTYEVIDANGDVQIIDGWFDEDYEQEVFRLTCQYREENGLNPLSYNTLCQEASDIRALEIVLRFDHTRPDGTR